MKRRFHATLAMRCALMTAAALPTAVLAQGAPAADYDLPAQSLAARLRSIARASGVNVLADGRVVDGRTVEALRGRFTAVEALQSVLQGTGLRTRMTPSGLVVESDGTPLATDEVGPNAKQDTIVVTGSRIRGAPVMAPVLRLSERQIRDAGQASLGEVARSIPQSFGGGQQPGIGFNVPAGNGVDVGGGSSINLRGLGSDATLTLLNGHRLAYSSSRQSVDVSTIPLSIVDRLEIVADGASAIYGSDAVAGVANVILKKDYSGLETRVRLGAATDGGDFTQQYGALAGSIWRTGGLAVAYQYDSNTAIRAEQRSYGANRPGLDLFPALRSHNVLATGHQALTDSLTLSLDALYGHRSERTAYPEEPGAPRNVTFGQTSGRTSDWALAPSLDWSVGRDWHLGLAGTVARDRTRFRSEDYFASVLSFTSGGCYCNDEQSVEVSGSGSVATLPGGAARIAVGAGYRNNDFELSLGAGNAQNIARSQDSYYAYGEVSLPLVSQANARGGINRLNLTSAVRYERYPGVGDVATPKLGLLYEPTNGLALKGSWGQSFRAPTLRQQYQPKGVTLFRPAQLGGTGFPAGTTVAYVIGGNADLRPERARSWSASIDLHPAAIPGLHAELGYFHTVYRDRIVTPIALRSQALVNPIYRDYVTLAPTAAQVSALVSSALTFFNSSGVAYDPATVVAIVDTSNVNAGRQRIHGVDLLLDYHMALGRSDRSIDLAANASYLTSDQRIAIAQPTTKLAGNIFNPPRLRLRASATLRTGEFALTGVVSHIGGVDDVRSSPAKAVDGMTPIDLTARMMTDRDGLLGGLDVTLSVQNVLNDKPSSITGIFIDAPYDSTNYSPVGRFVSISVAKKW